MNLNPVYQFIHESRESCWKHSIVAGVAGSMMGVGLGTFLGTFEGAHGELVGTNMRQQLYHGFRKSFIASYDRSIYFSKEFAIIGTIYAGIECTLERERAKRDLYNSTFAGGCTGAIMGLWSGRTLPPAVMIKSASKASMGFAAITTLFDYFFHHYNK